MKTIILTKINDRSQQVKSIVKLDTCVELMKVLTK